MSVFLYNLRLARKIISSSSSLPFRMLANGVRVRIAGINWWVRIGFYPYASPLEPHVQISHRRLTTLSTLRELRCVESSNFFSQFFFSLSLLGSRCVFFYLGQRYKSHLLQISVSMFILLGYRHVMLVQFEAFNLSFAEIKTNPRSYPCI